MLPLTVAETLQTTAVIRSLSNLALIFRIITEVCWQHFSTLCFSASTEPFIHFRKETDKRMRLNISELKASNQGRSSVPFWRLWTGHQYSSMGDGFGLSLLKYKGNKCARPNSPRAMGFSWVSFPLRGHLSLSGNTFGCRNFGRQEGRCHWQLVGINKDTPKHPTMHRTVSQNKDLSDPKCK